MRKRYKNKRCACRLCKGYKRKQSPRWNDRELAALRRFERAIARGEADAT